MYAILDKHVSRADWCRYEGDGNALRHSLAYPEERWRADWRFLARRYKNHPAAIGADLRNELQFGATWGGQDPALDWHAGRAWRQRDSRRESDLLIFARLPVKRLSFA